MRSRSVLLAAAGAMALVAGGCGTKTIDTGDLEDKLAKELAPQGGVKPDQIKVDCPDDQKAEKGKSFDCTLTAPDKSTAKIVVTLTNDSGHFTATVPEDQFK